MMLKEDAQQLAQAVMGYTRELDNLQTAMGEKDWDEVEEVAKSLQTSSDILRHYGVDVTKLR